MNPRWWESPARFVHSYWWIILLVVALLLGAYFTSPLWLALLLI